MSERVRGGVLVCVHACGIVDGGLEFLSGVL